MVLDFSNNIKLDFDLEQRVQHFNFRDKNKFNN